MPRPSIAEVDGVTVVWRERPGPLRAVLAFGAGIRDETLDTLGVIDAVAAAAGPAWEPTVDIDTTTFDLTGPDVPGALARLCAALAAPPFPVAAEAEDCRSGEDGLAARLLQRRYGPAGPGLAGWPLPRYAELTAEAVHRCAATYFVAGNAALVLTGPPPAGLRLPLRPGPRPDRPDPEAVAVAGPSWFDTAGTGVAVALRSPRGVAASLQYQILVGRITRAVEAARLRWRVRQWEVDVGPGVLEQILELAPARSAAPPGRAAELLWRELRRLAADPPDAQEVAAALALFAGPDDPDDPADLMDEDDTLDAALYGLPPLFHPDAATAAAACTAADRQAVAVAWTRSALLAVPENAGPDRPDGPGRPGGSGGSGRPGGPGLPDGPDLPGLRDQRCPRDTVVPAGTVFHRHPLHRLVSAAARTERLILGPDSIARVDPAGRVHTIRFADVVVAAERGDARVVHGRDGCVIAVDPERFPLAGRMVRAVDAQVPPRRRPEVFD